MTKKNVLTEKNFIHEGYSQDPFPFWFWLTTVVAFTAMLWGGYAWYSKKLTAEYAHDPFLQVTNREMSIFLWQEPELMRINASPKTAYLPGFQYVEKVSLEVPFADDYVIAPPETIFRYHAWHRLISKEFAQRPIPVNEFREFLDYAEEWKPENWAAAPEGYAKIVQHLDDQQELAVALPLSVRMAFQGWKNYFIEGDAINALDITYQELESFLALYPHYARNDWRNISGENYLSSLLRPVQDKHALVPTDEAPAFLRVALYNHLKARPENAGK